jgi:hypothetical protein
MPVQFQRSRAFQKERIAKAVNRKSFQIRVIRVNPRLLKVLVELLA